MQRLDELLARDIALAKLDSQAKSFAIRLKIEDERLWARAGSFFIKAFAPGLIARQSTLRDAMNAQDTKGTRCGIEATSGLF